MKEDNTKPITRDTLIHELATSLNLPLKQAKLTVEAMLSAMTRALRDGDKVEIRGFGTFQSKERVPRKARNPRTGELMMVPARKVPQFRPGKELAALINQKEDWQK